MCTDLMERALDGLTAWHHGDIHALADMLDPSVELLAAEPGPWDCHGKEAVLALLTERSAAAETAGDLELVQLGDDRLLVTGQPTPGEGTAPGRSVTVVTFSGGLVVRMQQFRSVADAHAASG